MPSLLPRIAPPQKVWFITGTSSGFGQRLVSIALARGDLVIATVRRRADFVLPAAGSERVHVLELDVCDSPENIKAAVAQALAVWGRIDVLVNNAGYGHKSLVQEASADRIMHQFQVNVFGTVNVTNAVLPSMRKRRSGLVVFMGSRAVFRANQPLAGLYIASKAAMHSLAETYAAELQGLNVQVMIVAPGAFRTEQMHNGPITADEPAPELDPMRNLATQVFLGSVQKPQGDPQKAMELVVDVVREEGRAQGRPMPKWLFLGDVAYAHVGAKCTEWEQALNEWEDVARELNFDTQAPT